MDDRIFSILRCRETLLEFGYRDIDQAAGVHFQEVYEHELQHITICCSSCS
ncbi:hypothetical protein [Streptococcus equi]|uniref:hypothetical protein n=1 Tax=Streptococcus equi TaxID=1336 RepID=UPI00355C4964